MATKSLYITAHWSSYSKEFQYSLYGYNPSTANGIALLEKREINFETPNDTTLRLRIAESLKEKRGKILADAYLEAKEVDETIQELLALEDKSGTDVASAKLPGGDDDIPF